MSGIPGRHIRHLLLGGAKKRSHFPRKFCCQRMEFDLKQECRMHKNPLDCPDHLFYYSSLLHEYGLIVHDGGGSLITIHFCPWCGADLSRPAKAKRVARRKSRTR